MVTMLQAGQVRNLVHFLPEHKSKGSRQALRPAQLLVQWILGTLSLGRNWAGCEVD